MFSENKKTYLIVMWHGFFLALTMSMIDFNTVFPALISRLVDSKILFGLLYSIMLGVPLIFNIIFSHLMNSHKYRKKFLLFGLYIRAFSFLGMAIFTYYFAEKRPMIVIGSFFILIFIFSFSGGFAGLSYSDIIGKLVKKGNRGKLYASKQFAASVAALIGGLLVKNIFTPGNFSFPINYSLILFIGFVGLIIAGIAFWFINEPPSTINNKDNNSLKEHFKKVPNILKKDQRFSQFIIVENLASFSRMLLPFYIIYAQDTFAINKGYVGTYLLYQISGTILSNIIWGYISNKLGSKLVVRICILGGSLLPILALLITPLGPDYYKIIFFLIGFLISGRKVGFVPYLLNISPDEKRTDYLGVRGTFNIMVVMLPFLGGVFIDFLGYTLTFSLVSGIMLTAFLIIGNTYPHEQHK
jgi:MFS family permease